MATNAGHIRINFEMKYDKIMNQAKQLENVIKKMGERLQKSLTLGSADDKVKAEIKEIEEIDEGAVVTFTLES